MTVVTEQGTSSSTAGWFRGLGEVSVPIGLLAALLPVRGVGDLLPRFAHLPVNSLAATALVVTAMWLRPRWRVSWPLLTVSATALAAWLVVNTVVVHEIYEIRRAGNIVVVVALAAVIGSGRLHLSSVTTGAIAGFVLATVTAIGTIPISSYKGRLTGVLGDPNAAGFVLTALGFALAQSLPNSRFRAALWGFVAVAVLLTQSRTSIFALVVATAWVLFARHLNRVFGALALAGSYLLYRWLLPIADGWQIFQEREGSDELREKLAQVEQQMVDTAGWFGNGLGSGVAEVKRGVTMYFHNSYRTMLIEGGWIALILLVMVIVALYLMFHRVPQASRPVWAEAGIIAGLICAFNIGFALTHIAMGLTVGLFVAYNSQVRTAREQDALPAAYKGLTG